MNNLPIIRLQLESMSQTILHAFNDQQLQLSEELQRQLAIFCTPENIGRILHEQVESAIKQAVKAETEKYYLWGPGREVVRAAVIKKLDSYKGLDTL